MKRLSKVKIKWSPEFAYAIGLIVTDGSLSIDGRHINFTSKEIKLINTFKKCLGLKNKVGKKARGGEEDKKYFQVQFGDINFYEFLLTIGLTPAKSKTLSSLKIQDKYLFDFLRGHFDGDGTFYSYWDPRWRSSFMFYTVFCSASKKHMEWLRNEIYKRLNIRGHVTKGNDKVLYQLKYAKKDSLKLLKRLYYSDDVICLKRKRLKVDKALSIIGAVL